MNLSLAKLAAPAALTGAKMLIDNREVIWNGAKWVYSNMPPLRKKKNLKGKAVSVPQSLPGAIAAPVAYAYPVRGGKLKFQNSKGNVCITHREHVKRITNGGTADFTINNGNGPLNDYSLNPMNPYVFPWLSTMAANFDKYRFTSVLLEYVPLCATDTPGRVAIYFDADSGDFGPDDESALVNYAHMSAISPWALTKLRVPTDGVKRLMADNVTLDPKLINLGKIGWATYACETTNMGELMVSYTVELFEPQPTAAIVESLYHPDDGTSDVVGPVYFSYEASSPTGITLQARVPGTYLINVIANVTANTFTTPTITSGGTINSAFAVASATKFSYTASVTVRLNANLTFAGMTGLSNVQLFSAKASRDNTVLVS